MGVLCGSIAAPAQEPVRYDVVLRGGTVHVGDGSEPVVANVAIEKGRIAAIGPREMPGRLVLDCTGLVVCPGFIDLHNHSDGPILGPLTRGNVNYLLQGCTTVVTGNCGAGPVDVGTYLKKVDQQRAGTHVAHLLPAGSLRDEVMGKSNRAPTEAELARMRELADKAMQDGAFGMSTGLIYIPGIFTETEELIEIARVVARHDGIYASHIRGEGKTLLQAVTEAIRIGEEADLPVHISHFKASGRPYWGTLRLAIGLVEDARKKGAIVTADQYPYIASSTSLDATLLPGWSREGGHKELEKRLEDPEIAARIRHEVLEDLKTASRIQIASCGKHPDWVGMSLDEIAKGQGAPVIDIVMQIERDGGAQVVNFGMSEDDVRSAMPLSWVATASDGGAKIPTADQPHPRSFGTFPRKIGRYAIEEKVLSLAAAIRSSSGLPAEILGLTDRGLLKVGLAADIVAFDPQTFRDRATFEQPTLPAAGAKYVLVEGTLAVYDGQATGALAGKALRKGEVGGQRSEVSSQESGARGQRSEVGGQKSGELRGARGERATGGRGPGVENQQEDLTSDRRSLTSDLRSPTSDAPVDAAVRRLAALVKEQHGRGQSFSIDFDAYRGDLASLPIGVFDSGIGGLTVLEALLSSDLHENSTGKPGSDGVPDLAGERLLYLGDQANMPYGNYVPEGKEGYLRELILKDALFLLGNRYWPEQTATSPKFDKPPVKAIVIACNTGTAYGLEDLRRSLETWGVPVIVVGVVEAGANSLVEQLPKDGEPGAVAVLATTGTCSSDAYPKAIARIAGQRGRRSPQVVQQGSLGIAAVIEHDPAFLSDAAAKTPAAVSYRGPAVGNPQAPLDAGLLPAYGFDDRGIVGDPAKIDTWRLNSIDNYIRYDVTTLVENYRKSGRTQPIGYVMLGCTHYPFEAERFRAAFARLREFGNEQGEQPYRNLIAERVELVDPAQLTAKETYRALFLARKLAPQTDSSLRTTSNTRGGANWNHARLFVSVPSPDVPPSALMPDGSFTHDYKYSRAAALFDVEDTRIVPLSADRMPSSIRTLIESRCPNVWACLTTAL